MFASVQGEAAEPLAGFDAHRLTAIAEFLTRGTDFACRRAPCCAQTLTAGGAAWAAAPTVAPADEKRS